MSQDNKKGNIIMSNILYLASIYNKGSQRNLLNKWFQDSIKNYVLESIASPLLVKYLNCNHNKRVKDFIEKNLDKTKPKYMSIMELYFQYIKKFDLCSAFKERLNTILLNPIDYQVQQFSQTYNNEKAIRKQFVCYLVLRYFESYDNQEFPSFYELWNFCFPQEIQTKKKLSRFDLKIAKTKSNHLYKKNICMQDSYLSSDSLLNSTTFVSLLHKNISSNQESSSNINHIAKESHELTNISQQSQLNYQEEQFIRNKVTYSQKKPINNHIFEDYDDDEKQEEQEQILSQQIPTSEQREILFDQHSYLQTESQQTQQDLNLIYYFPFYQTNNYQIFTQPFQNTQQSLNQINSSFYS